MNLEWLSVLRLRIGALVHRRRLERDLQEELAFHLAARGDDARRRFGNPTAIQEELRDMWTFRWIEMLKQDARYALRTLTRTPVFTAVAVLTLALGIGANTAIFSVVDAVILRSLPYPQADRLVMLWGNVKRAKVERRGTSFADYADWRDRSRSFETMSILVDATATLAGAEEPERINTMFVAEPYFRMLGEAPAVGRTFSPEEDQVPQRNPVAVLSDGLWKRRFGGDPGVIGRAIQLDGKPFTVIGVMPSWFRGVTDDTDLWMPLMMAGTPQDFADRGGRGPVVLARLKPGVSMTQAQAEMNEICKQLERLYPRTNEARGVELAPLEKELLGDFHTPLLVLWVAVAFVLLIACCNVANLLLARSEARQREIAVRIALGAGRGRVLHQLMVEGFVLVMFGACGGLLLARFGIRALLAASPVVFPSYIHPGLDLRVTLCTVLIACAAAVALGISPVVQVRSGELGNRSGQNRGGVRYRSILVVTEVAFAMLLLVGAGLLMRSLQQLSAIRPGYDPSHVLVVRVSLPRGTPASAREVLTAAGRVPSVESVAAGSDVPLSGGGAIFYEAEGQPEGNATNRPRAYVHAASPRFFQTLRIPLLAGRTFTEEEMGGNPKAVVVSEALVKRFWPGQDPIGKRIRSGGPREPWSNIVGVVNDMKYRGVPENPTADPEVFVPFAPGARNFRLVFRTPLEPGSIAPAVRRALHEADPTMVVFGTTTMEELMGRETARARFTGWMMAIFAAAALLLAMIGIYGVMSYAVSRRTQEIGLRMALGAARGQVLRLVVGRGMALVAVGLAIGMAAALGLTRLIGGLLYGVKPHDGLSFAAAAVALFAVAFLASAVPAGRATRIDPAIALRNE